MSFPLLLILAGIFIGSMMVTMCYARHIKVLSFDNTSSNEDAEPPKVFDTKHLLIRLILIMIIPAVSVIIMLLIESDDNRPYRSNSSLGAFLLALFEVIIMELYILFEALWCHLKKQYAKRNSNLLITMILTLAGFCFYLSEFA